MSLIQDALKRQQEEMDKKDVAGASAPPARPVDFSSSAATAPNPSEGRPLPSTTTAGFLPKIQLRKETPKVVEPPEIISAPDLHTNEPKSEKRNRQTVVLVVLFLLFLLGIGVYFEWPVLVSLLRTPTPPPQSPTTLPLLEPDQVSSVSTALPPPVMATTTSTDTLAEINLFLPEGSNDVPVATASTSAPTEPLVPTNPPSVSEPEPMIKPLPVSWPFIKLTGLVKLGKTSAALIDGKIVVPGETMGEVLLVKVTAEGALVRYQDEERLLRVGETAR